MSVLWRRFVVHSYSKILLHVVFATRGRRPLITDEMKGPLWVHFGSIVRREFGELLIVNGVADHVHLLVDLHRSGSAARLVGALKANTCRRLRDEGRDFGWQGGYGIFSVSESSKARIYRYIARQEQHHRSQSSRSEMQTLLLRHNRDPDAAQKFAELLEAGAPEGRIHVSPGRKPGVSG